MRISTLFIFLFICISGCKNEETTIIDLSGLWQFQIDSLDIGILEKWYNSELKDEVSLPGSMTTNGKGLEVSVNTNWTGGIVDSSWYNDEKYAKYREPGNVKIPFWLQPVKHYVGAAWYKKSIEIPENWSNKYIELNLERCHWETRVWVDDREVGSQNSLSTAHVYNLTDFINPGNHTLSILVDNRVKNIDPGENSHSITDHTQSNWNGIVGKIELIAKPKILLDNIQIYPDVVNGTVSVKGTVLNYSGKNGHGDITISTVLKSPGADPEKIQVEEKIEINEQKYKIDFEFSLGDELGIWDEFYPNLYTMKIQLETESGIHEQEIIFGMREFYVDGTRFSINGHPVFLRGTLECAIFPKSGYPSTDVEEWKRIIKVCKAHGLNHMRFHSWCPPEAAFVAADELGFYLQVECSSWANQSTTLGDGLPIDRFVYNESEQIVKMYGNHPSFCMMAYGNEPRGRNHTNFLAGFVNHWKEKDNRRVYTGGAGWPILMENDYHNIPGSRIQGWGEELNSIINSQAPSTDYDWSDKIIDFEIPVVSHEIGQWCAYPNFNEIEKYDGVLQAKNFEIFQESLRENDLGHLADSFLLASGKLQALCYKAEIEAALRTPGFGGFQLLDLHDFPGQGTALVGVLDPFWEEKGYITPEEFSRFCNTTVPLARMEKRIFYSDESFIALAEVAHFGEEELIQTVPGWCITDQKMDTLFHGYFDTLNISIGNNIHIGKINVELGKITEPKKLLLSLNVNGFENDWGFWVYPKKHKIIEDVLVSKNLDQHALDHLENGGSVLWSIPESTKGKNLNDGIGFSSIFWNTSWTKGQKPHSLGILCNPEHAALRDFPTEFHSNWQWWDAMTFSNGLILDDFPKEIKPIVRVIDDWFQNRKQALLIELKVGKGKMIISGIDFHKNIDNRIEGKQLLRSLKKYMASENFDPEVEMSVEEIRKLL